MTRRALWGLALAMACVLLATACNEVLGIGVPDLVAPDASTDGGSRDAALPDSDATVADVMPGDFLAVRDAGAYGFVLSSNYNSRPRAPEILVEGAAWRIVRARETYEDLVRGETV